VSLRRINQTTKATATASAFLVAVGIAQYLLLDVDPEHAWVVALPLLVCAPGTWFYVRTFMNRRVKAFHRSLARAAQGDLEQPILPASDRELEPIHAAFSRMQTALRESSNALRRADAARRQLFADLAHELGTPTATVVALADALELPDVEASAEKRAELLHALVGEGLRLSRLVGDLRDLAELDDPEIALEEHPTDVVKLVRDTAKRLGLSRPERAAIAIDAPETLHASVDPHRLEQVLVNVLVNAYRYTPRDRSIEVALTEAGDRVRLTVDDGGKGVDDAVLARLGERLFRADPSRNTRTGGSGLGLSIVRAIVERHRGTLRFERSPLGGLRVRVELPRGELAGP
jgi:signal transduction histidine kinase